MRTWSDNPWGFWAFWVFLDVLSVLGPWALVLVFSFSLPEILEAKGES
jgi:hypothetical protein